MHRSYTGFHCAYEYRPFNQYFITEDGSEARNVKQKTDIIRGGEQMKRLTAKRVNGIKRGYWSSARKDDLVQALESMKIPDVLPQEVMDVCFYYEWNANLYSGKEGLLLVDHTA